MNAKLPGSTKQRAGILSAALALIGVILIVVAACTSRPGPPQPTSAQGADPVSAAAPVTTSAAASTPGSSTGSKAATPGSTSQKSTTPKSTTTKSAGPTSTSPKSTSKPSTSSAAPSPLLLPASMPTKLTIPSIGVSSDLLKLGLNPDGTVQVQSLDDPDSKAGWYDQSPEPGTIGPSVLLGHVDSKKYGPGVFYQLGALQKGGEVDVTRGGGTTAVFTVDSVESYSKDAFPTATVYHDLTYSGLRLITCGGTFDPSKGSYESNIVAYATLKTVKKA